MIGFKRYFIVGTNDSCLHDTMNGAVTGELIRCMDCKYYEEQDETIGTCLLTESGAHIKGYCSWAEMKEE